ncbi:hypothetical protein AVEN_201071-1, partial [Araneus ventricosus]
MSLVIFTSRFEATRERPRNVERPPDDRIVYELWTSSEEFFPLQTVD